jgi:putative hemolysin
MTTEKKLHVDIEKVIESKLPAGKKRLPKFLIRLIEKLIHQDELNQALSDLSGKEGVEFATEALRWIDVDCRIHGGDLLDPNKRYIFVCNHPLGGLDGIILMSHFGQRFPVIRFVVNDLLLFIEPLRNLFIPVNKFGKMKQDYAAQIQQAFDSEAQILYFPAGLCSRKIGKEVVDLEWKKTFVVKARESQRDIVPLYFDGLNSKWFYRIERWRSRLGIKFNIAMLYLADEMYKNRHKTFRIVIGKPIPWQTFDKSKSHAEWAEHVKGIVYNLKDQSSLRD